MRPLVLALLAIATLPSCQTPQRGAGLCGDNDVRPWAMLSRPPSDADELRNAANTKPNFNAMVHFERETWFRLPTGETMLCRSDDSPRRSCSGEWWQFSRATGELSVTDQNAWICVT